MATNSFRPKKFEDHEIVGGDGKVVGHIRVKPIGIMWAPTNSQIWYGLPLKAFSEYMVANGKKREK